MTRAGRSGSGVSDKRKRAARAIQAETGWNYTRALREADRRHAEAQAASPSRTEERAMAGFGEFLQNLLAPTAEPGPPYVHTLVPPDEGRHWDRFMLDEDGGQ